MSLVSSFVQAAHAKAAAIIGQEPVIVADVTIQCVLAEADQSREFSEGGFEVANRMTAVCLTSSLPSTSLLKKQALARGVMFRVEAVSKGGSFTTLTLEEDSKA